MRAVLHLLVACAAAGCSVDTSAGPSGPSGCRTPACTPDQGLGQAGRSGQGGGGPGATAGAGGSASADAGSGGSGGTPPPPPSADAGTPDAGDAGVVPMPPSCMEGAQRACGTATGACDLGTQHCADGQWGGCEGEVGPSAEICDAVDNDCDPVTADGADELWLLATCDGDDADLCAEGVFACTDGTQACSDDVYGHADVCDGIDNDCNPATPDGNDETWLGDACDGTDSDLCAEGSYTCFDGAQTCTDQTGSDLELCDGLDNDCNSSTDDGADEAWLGDACDGGDSDLCAEGNYACTSGEQACSDETGNDLDLCDGSDNDCNAATFDGADETWYGDACDGGDSDLCAEGGYACTAGDQACTDATGNDLELCDDADNDCNAATFDGADETWYGDPCDGGDSDLCAEGTLSCTTGAQSCTDATGDEPELCDGVDNDCNALTFDGADETWLGDACDGTDSDLCAEGAFSCTTGAQSCDDSTGDTLDVCDEVDNDCNAATADGSQDASVGSPCGAQVGDCVTEIVCRSGSLSCIGTFVAPTGGASNPGTQGSPLNTVAAGIANAAEIGGGADVCVCASSTSTPSSYAGDVNMQEGISVLGGYACSSWTRNITSYVVELSVSNAVSFPAGITGATRLDGVDVIGGSTAVLITDSSPALVDVDVSTTGGSTSYGVWVRRTGSDAVAPVLTRGTISATASNSGTAFALLIDGASPVVRSNAIQPSSPSSTPAVSAAVRCVGCAGSDIDVPTIAGEHASSASYGIWASGDVQGLTVAGNTAIIGATTDTPTGYGVWLDACSGVSTWTASIHAGSSEGQTRKAFRATGSACAPSIEAAGLLAQGTSTNATTVGLECDGAPCSVIGSDIDAVGGLASTSVRGISCIQGGCALIQGSQVSASFGSDLASTVSTALDLSDGSPYVDGNTIGAVGNCSQTGLGTYSAAYLGASTAILVNNVVIGAYCSGTTLQYGTVHHQKSARDGTWLEPTIVNNTIDGGKMGIRIVDATDAPALGIIRNNIIYGQDTAGAIPVYSAGSPPRVLTHNDLYNTNSSYLYYPYTTIAEVNAQPGASANISANPDLGTGRRLNATSPCRNAGTALDAPAFDRDGDSRPQEVIYDIGADEYQP